MSKHRNFVFTLNNYTDEHVEALKALECRYIIFGKEVAPTTGTPHLQGYVAFTNTRHFKSVARLFPWTVAAAKGSAEENRVYCSKEGCDVYERGDPPISQAAKGQLEIDRHNNAKELAKKGRFDEIPSDLYARFRSAYRHYPTDFIAPVTDLEGPADLKTGLWIYGEPRTGKSSYARAKYPDLYSKAINKWWDRYTDQETVLIDDLDHSHSAFMMHWLKIWCDRYAFNAETKGGTITIRPKLIIITSNETIEEVFRDHREIHVRALKMRFDFLHMK